MKKISTFALLLIGSLSFAQAPKKIQLASGQKIEIVMSNNSVTDLGMGMQMTNNSTVTNKMVVTAEDDNNFELSSTITRMQMTMEGMGQNMTFDSDKKEDMESEMGQGLGDNLNKAETVKINKVSGKQEKTKVEEKKEGNPMAGMSGMMGSEHESDLVFLIPTDKKIGDTWSEENKEKDLTTKRSYTLKSIDNNIATVTLTGSIDGTMEQEVQGNNMNMTINTKMTGDLTVNIATGLVIKKNIVSDINGSIDMMGQQMPISSKNTSAITYNY